ncbi:hypothetical protein F5880DRAFT_587812 [Lentinula raphanica]|nr:hypothetical protein F5880DRAFT_587812 [Lentinula raphanica]
MPLLIDLLQSLVILILILPLLQLLVLLGFPHVDSLEFLWNRHRPLTGDLLKIRELQLPLPLQRTRLKHRRHLILPCLRTAIYPIITMQGIVLSPSGSILSSVPILP